jgi:ParB-like chromosome segregation protein Spo0J
MKIAIEKLKSSGKNPRKITKAGIERLKKSISENPDFFEARPILVNHVGDDYIIIGGHQRLEAAKQLGMKEVPIFAFENLSDDQFDNICSWIT